MKIMGVNVPIIRKSRKIMGKDLGEYCAEARVIKVVDDIAMKYHARTVLHELVHAVLDIGGVSAGLEEKTEEAICTAMENFVPSILDGNLIIALVGGKRK